MEGGINAWRGFVAAGAPEAGMAYFSPATKPEELIALAWLLEDGSHKFYAELTQRLKDQEAKDLLGELAAAEKRHQASLLDLYSELSGLTPASGFPESIVSGENEGDVMEGGMRVKEVLEWTRGRSVTEILELSLSSETNSYDLYVKMELRMKDQRSAEVFRVLSGEERQHLERISSMFEKRI
jgi:rubrerythrin